MCATERAALRVMVVLAISVSAIGGAHRVQAAGSPARASDDARVEQLLERLTLDEKTRLIHDGTEDPLEYQSQGGHLDGVARLGIPDLRLADGPPGGS